MLYEGAIRFLERALAGYQLEDPECNETISNNIIQGLLFVSSKTIVSLLLFLR